MIDIQNLRRLHVEATSMLLDSDSINRIGVLQTDNEAARNLWRYIAAAVPIALDELEQHRAARDKLSTSTERRHFRDEYFQNIERK